MATFNIGDSVRIKRQAQRHMHESGYDFEVATIVDIIKLHSDGYYCTVVAGPDCSVCVHESILRLA